MSVLIFHYVTYLKINNINLKMEQSFTYVFTCVTHKNTNQPQDQLHSHSCSQVLHCYIHQELNKKAVL